MKEIIFASLFFLLSIGALIISIRSFQEKGFLFHNAYIYASKQERENMDKKPYYCQSAISFLLSSIALLLLGIGIILTAAWAIFAAMAVAVFTGIYVVAKDIALEKQKRS